MYKGRPIEKLSPEEWKQFIDDMLRKEAENKKMQKRIEEERRQLEAAKQLLNMTGDKQSGTSTVIRGTIGTLTEFSMSENWSLWFERFEQYCVTNEVPGEKYVSLFLTSMGKDAYGLLRDLCSPQKPATMRFKELAEIMSNHLQPAPSVIMERYRFKECRQSPEDDVKAYVARLKKVSMFCEFGNGLETNLRDQFVWGISSETTKKRLLGEKELTSQRAIEIALSLESAGRDAARMQGGTTATASALNFMTDKKKGAGKKNKQENKGDVKKCFCCGKSNHQKSECRYKDFKCNACGKVGHLQVVCRNKTSASSSVSAQQQVKPRGGRTTEKHNFVEEEPLGQALDSIFALQSTDVNKACDSLPFRFQVSVENEPLFFEIDTGSPITAISEKVYREKANLYRVKLLENPRVFKTYHEKRLTPLGVLRVQVKHVDKELKLELFVLPGNTETPIMGREWLRPLNIIHVNSTTGEMCINSLKNEDSPSKVLISKFSGVFSDKIGLYTGGKFSLHVKPDTNPVFCKVRAVPFALRSKLEQEIARLEKDKIIEPVKSSEWATPVVPVLKTSGQIRLCGDYKISLNPHLIVDRHPIPRVADLLANLEGGKLFSKLDLAHAYQQIELDEESKNLTTITTHKGLYKYNRLSYGIASAPGLFQREMEKIVNGIPGVKTYFDDVLISEKSREEHDERLFEVLKRFEQKGLTVKPSKCKIAQKCIQFLGYELDEHGLHVAQSKIDAIINMKTPTNIKELQSFLGACNYYSRFIKNYAQIMSPLYKLLKKDVEWQWTTEREKAFEEAKLKLTSHEVLVHYDSDVPIKITCDASPKGLGAVLSHIFPSGKIKHVAFASRVLNSAEKNYSQLDREALALVFGVKAFHQYVYGRPFILETDHKPLTYIFGKKKGIPQMAASRVQRWAVILSGYDFEIRHIKGTENGPADALSRMLIDNFKADPNNAEREDYSFLNFVSEESNLIDVNIIRQETLKDPVLIKVRNFLIEGWPLNVEEKLQPYKNRQLELTLENDCIFWGHRIVIPTTVIESVLGELHSAHMGIVKMKAQARSFVWWPGIDKMIENTAKSCELCLQYGTNPPRSILHTWKWPEAPNERVHVDFCGPIDGHMYLIITDAYSKWIDIREMNNITASSTIKVLKEYISTWGLPIAIVSDNGPTFTATEFQAFLKKNNIKHFNTAPYHPASNGAAENAVKTFKSKFKLLTKEMTRHEALVRYLFVYRSAPHCTTGCSPAELQLGRKLRTRLSAIDASVRENVIKNQEKQKLYFNGNRNMQFNIGDTVMAKDFSFNQWRKAQVIDKLGPVTYNVRADNNKMWKRHVDQIRTCEEKIQLPFPHHCHDNVMPATTSDTVNINSNMENEAQEANATIYKQPAFENNCANVASSIQTARQVDTAAKIVKPAVEELRRSTRVRKAPQRLNI
ncbi:uncharacterized protein K02A2.6-like [Copidosoma floridanum]|uniref:uncharacterized protein K02A2.6-like n=1 Tax=Copidosoma floridanum TaxID=29053 RepID=UPI0006C9A5BE|nr:uncharacterized protein K02A2.6-like [Copidosoma floridanum]